MAAPDERVTLADGEMRALDDLSLPVAGSAAADALVHAASVHSIAAAAASGCWAQADSHAHGSRRPLRRFLISHHEEMEWVEEHYGEHA